jgi:predicted alpha/beta-fold hydrolase
VTPSFRPRPFHPSRWAEGPHAQTLGARVLRNGADPGMRRERWETPDGDFLDVDLGPDPGPGAPVVMVVHGLEGSSRRRYVLGTCRELHARGVRPVAMNLRGCSGTPNRLPRMYHSGETTDLAFVLGRLRAGHPGRAIGAFGFSLGGNALLKLLGSHPEGGVGLADAAVAMSIPFDLAAGAEQLERTRMGHLYATYFLRSLRRKVRSKEPMLRGHIDVDVALRARTLRAFDDAATAPLHGFRDAAHYYDASSSTHYLPGIRVPTLIIHSLDDPFLPREAVPRPALESNEAIVALLSVRGGHVGFLEGTPWSPRLWGDEEGARFLEAALGARKDGGGGRIS